MNILFIDPIDWDYNVETVHQRPMGGSQSALCYLSEELAKRGHDVTLLTNTREPGTYRGVRCMHSPTTTSQHLEILGTEVCITINGCTPYTRDFIGDDMPLILWTQHDADQRAVDQLYDPAICDQFDGFVFVSEWQRNRYLHNFQIHPDKTAVLRNAAAPEFENLFDTRELILSAKTKPPVLAYTSTPFRGLGILLNIFPAIRKAFPGTALKVFSSMAVYQVPEEEDRRQFETLYEKCRKTPGVEYRGSVTQSQLAQELRSVTALVYPNTFPETSCIAVLEAMAAGCKIITTHSGALPETTAEYGTLVLPSDDNMEFAKSFYDATYNALRQENQEPLLREQVNHIHKHHTWSHQAEIWESWLSEVVAGVSK